MDFNQLPSLTRLKSVENPVQVFINLLYIRVIVITNISQVLFPNKSYKVLMKLKQRSVGEI